MSLFVNLANIMKVFIFCEENVSVCPSDVCLYFHIEQLRELHYVVCQVWTDRLRAAHLWFNQVFYFTAIQGYLCKRPFHNVLHCHRVEKATLVGVWTVLWWALGSCCRAIRCVVELRLQQKTQSQRDQPAESFFLPIPRHPFLNTS